MIECARINDAIFTLPRPPLVPPSAVTDLGATNSQLLIAQLLIAPRQYSNQNTPVGQVISKPRFARKFLVRDQLTLAPFIAMLLWFKE